MKVDFFFPRTAEMDVSAVVFEIHELNYNTYNTSMFVIHAENKVAHQRTVFFPLFAEPKIILPVTPLIRGLKKYAVSDWCILADGSSSM